MADLPTPRVDAIAAHLGYVDRTNDLIRLTRQLERELAAAEQRAKAAEELLRFARTWVAYALDKTNGDSRLYQENCLQTLNQIDAAIDAARRKDAA